MSALQLHYTSCRRGLTGQAGFQVRAATPGILPDEQREIERRAGYQPPRDAPLEPSPEEIDRDFPVAFRWWPLDSGRAVLVRSSYVGQDYSGRWGNFFAHALVVGPGAATDRWPIDLYEWDGWRSRLEPGEDDGEPPPELSPVPLEATPSAVSFELEELGAFLRDRSDGAALLARMGRALLLGLEDGRRLIVRDSPTDSLFWVAAIQKLFPPRHARSLSFSTYQDDPRGCAVINATTGDTDFRFDETERSYRFYVFDLATGNESEVPEDPDDYPAVAAEWLAEQPETLRELFGFFDLFDHSTPEPGLAAAIDLFRLARGDAAPPPDRLAAAIGFAGRHATADGRRQLLERLGAVATTRFDRPDDHQALLRFLAEGARATGEEAHRRLAFDAWNALIRHHVVEGRGVEIAREGWTVLGQTFSDHRPELARWWLGTEPWQELERAPDVAAELLYPTILESLASIGAEPPWEQPAARRSLAALAAADRFELALRPWAGRAEGLVVAVQIVLDSRLDAEGGRASESGRAVQQTVGRILGSLLSTRDAAAADARARLAAAGEHEVLYGEWLALRDRSDDLRTAFLSYRSAVLDVHPAYRREVLDRIRRDLLDRLPPAEAGELAVRWLAENDLEDDLARRAVRAAAAILPIDGEDAADDRLAEELAGHAERLGIRPPPERPLLRRAWAVAREGSLGEAHPDLAPIGAAVERLEPDETRRFLEKLLPRVLAGAETLKAHQAALAALVPAPSPRLAASGYQAFVRERNGAPWPACLQAALTFWLSFDAAQLPQLAPLEKVARRELVRRLGSLRPTRFEQIQRQLATGLGSDRARERWSRLEASVTSRRGNPLRRILKAFGRSPR